MPLTRTEQRVLFTAIAFAAVAQRQDNLETPAATEKIRMLAELIERYCVETVMKPAAAVTRLQEPLAYKGQLPQRRADDWRLCESQNNLLHTAGELLEWILDHGFGYNEEQEAELLLSLIRDRQKHVDRIAV